MSTPWVVPAFDEVEDGEARVGLRAEAFAIEQLALERRDEALAQGVVVGIAHTAHRRPDAGLATAPAVGERGVLAALIRVMNHLGRSALRDGHVERGQDELGAEMGCHRPAAAWCAVTNSNPWTGSYWSPAQTRPRLLRGSLALRGAAGPRAGADALRHAPPSRAGLPGASGCLRGRPPLRH